MNTISPDEATTYVLLIQGVNVGGHSLLPMSVLRDALSGLGLSDVRTYLQSGNAVFTTSLAAAQAAGVAETALTAILGRDVASVVRTANQLAEVVEDWPFDQSADPSTKHVLFLRQATDVDRLEGMPAATMAPEQYSVSGAHVYLHLPGGMGRSKLGAWLTRRLAGTGATARNWNTVTALRDMAARRSFQE